MEAGLGPLYRRPRYKMWGGQQVATLVKVGFHRLSAPALYAAAEESRCGDNLDNAPAMLALAQRETLCAQGRVS